MAVTTYSWMSAPDTTSDAAFRKFAQGIHDAVIAAGWVQSSDTGQLAIATATCPTTTNTPAGYEIFKLNDAAQATAPVFVKVEYGRAGGTSPNNSPAIWFTVGQATNGAGTLSSILFARQMNLLSSLNGSVGTTTEYASYASGDGSSICLSLWAANTSYPCVFFVLERSRDTSGAATAEGFLIVLAVNSGKKVRVIGNGGVPGASKCADSGLVALLPAQINGLSSSTSSTMSKDGVTAPVIPLPCMAPGVTPWVSNVIVAVHPGDAGATSVIQAATINGQTRIYRAFPQFDGTSGVVGYSNAGSAIDSMSRPAIAWAV